MSGARGEFYCNSKSKLAYLAIRKCGSTSIAHFIASLKKQHVQRPLWGEEAIVHNFDKVGSDESALSDYVTFTFVRNPYDRFQSFYRNWIIDPPHERVLEHYRKFGLYVNMPFDECVNRFVQINETLALENHAVPMYHFVFRGDKSRVQHIGKLESLRRDMLSITSLNDVKLHENEICFPHQNKTSGINFYTPETKSLIYEYYKKDFVTFGYEK